MSTTAEVSPLSTWPYVGRADLTQRIVTALADQRLSGAILRGPMGVGKTRLADEVAATLAGRSWAVRRVAATGSTGSYAAVAHLLRPGIDTSDELAVAHAIAEALGADGDRGQALVIIDDLPALDAGTAGVVAALVSARSVSLLATARDGERLPGPFAGLVGSEHVAAIAVEPLDTRAVATLLHLVLRGPLDGAATAALTGPADGNPLYLRELLLTAVESGKLACADGVWALRDDLGRTTRLREVVESRLQTLSEPATTALELLALCESVELRELEEAAGLDALEELERRSLLRVDEDGAAALASLAHPFYGEAVRRSVPPLRRRSILRAHLERIEAVAPLNDLAAWQRLRLRLEAGLPVDDTTLLAAGAAALAADDMATAAAFLRPAMDHAPTYEGALLLGRAAFELGDFAGAESALALAGSLAPTPAERAGIAVTRSQVLLWGSSTAQDAIAALESELDVDDLDEATRELLDSEIGSHLVFAGQPAAALARIGGTHRWPEVSDGGTPSFLTALTLTGRTGEAIERARAAAAAAPTEVLPGLVARETYDVVLSFALTEAGDLDEAIVVAERGHEQATAEQRPLAQYWFALLLGRASITRGRLTDAQRWFAQARGVAENAGLGPPARLAHVGTTLATALLGDPASTAAAAGVLAAAAPFGFLAPESALAAAWASVVTGDLDGARTTLRDAAAEAAATGHRTVEAWLWHDLARLGDATGALAHLTRLVEQVDGELVAARLAHVSALAARDASALEDAGARFAAMGADLLAAEAYVAAAERHRGDGSARRATAASARAAELAGRTQGAHTPLLATASTVSPLTDREREVALLAVRGLQSRAIADQLFLSYRTVTNHLQRVYEKLGISGRGELADALGVHTGAVPA